MPCENETIERNEYFFVFLFFKNTKRSNHLRIHIIFSNLIFKNQILKFSILIGDISFRSILQKTPYICI